MANSFREKAEKKRASAGNPAMMFITPPEETQAEERITETRTPQAQREASTLKAGTPTLRRAPQGGEAKTRRLQLLIQPSLYEAVRARAEAEGMSVNETIGELLRQALGE